MATRKEEKERLRQARLEAERRQGATDRRRLMVGYAVAGVLTGAIVVGVVLVVLAGGDSGGSEGPFGTHYDGLQERREAAGVPTMSEGGGEHFHPRLTVYVEGEPVVVPTNIGIDPSVPTSEMAGLHTHDSSGTIHNEAGTGSTLGQFFQVWGVPFSRDRLGPHRANGRGIVRMWVDGSPSRAYEDLRLADGQQIVISYGPKDAPPPPGARG